MNRIEQLRLLKRLLIIFGSILFVWFIIGFIFLTIQTYRHFKRKTYRYNRSLQLPSVLLKPIEQPSKEDNLSDNDDQTSVFTSVSFISERSRISEEQKHFISSYHRIPEEEFELTFPNTAGIANLAYSRSTLSSSSDFGTSLLYYPAHRNFAYSQSTLTSSNHNFHEHTPTPSLIIPVNNLSSYQFNLNRQSSQSSTNTVSSQNTNATYISSQSSIKSNPLPTVMITDVDRLQTDIIELENFEPEKEFYNIRSPLRILLNDRMPQKIH